jgi:membrane associated rhomboid family serine protease
MVIPIWDRNPVRRVPVVTYLLILLNVGIFLTEPIAAAPLHASRSVACAQQAYFDQWGATPHELVTNRPSGTAVVGAVREGCLVGRAPYRKVPVASALTSAFLHGSWLHLLGNMLFLSVFGNNVEDRFGRLRYLLCYLGFALVAAYGFAVTQPGSHTTLVGASGAIAGVLGAYLVLYPRARVVSLLPFLFFLPAPLPAWLVLGSWFVLQWVYAAGAGVGHGGGVAYLAHVVGFVAGIVVASRLRRRRRLA